MNSFPGCASVLLSAFLFAVRGPRFLQHPDVALRGLPMLLGPPIAVETYDVAAKRMRCGLC